MYAGRSRSWSVCTLLLLAIGLLFGPTAHAADQQVLSDTFDLHVDSPDGLSWESIDTLPMEGFDHHDGKKQLVKVRIELRVEYDLDYVMTNMSDDLSQWGIAIRSQDVDARLPWDFVWSGPGGWTWGGVYLQAGESKPYTLQAEYIRIKEYEGADAKAFIHNALFPLDLRLRASVQPMNPKDISMEYQGGGIRSQVRIDYTYTDSGPGATHDG